MQQQKILFVDHTAVLGGAELSLLDLATAYAKTSKVILFSKGLLQDRLIKAGVECSIAQADKTLLEIKASGGLNSLSKIPDLWQMAGIVAKAAADYDLIVANSQKAFVISALATLRGSPPVVWYLRDILTANHYSTLNRVIAVMLANQFAAKVIVNSEATGKAFVAAGGKDKLYQVVYNGFDFKKFENIDIEATEKIRAELGVGNAPLVGVFSRLSYWKGQHLLLEAVKELPQVQVILVGKALFGEDEYVSELKALANQPQLEGRIHWLGFRDDIPTLMKTCDIIAHTSTEPEPFGRIIVEGQLAEKPVIASAAGGALELIEDKISGCLFPLGDAIALRQQIQLLLSDRSLANKIAHQGYLKAKANFGLETILASFAEALSTVDVID